MFKNITLKKFHIKKKYNKKNITIRRKDCKKSMHLTAITLLLDTKNQSLIDCLVLVIQCNKDMQIHNELIVT